MADNPLYKSQKYVRKNPLEQSNQNRKRDISKMTLSIDDFNAFKKETPTELRPKNAKGVSDPL